jgi:hypothetical protein
LGFEEGPDSGYGPGASQVIENSGLASSTTFTDRLVPLVWNTSALT